MLDTIIFIIYSLPMKNTFENNNDYKDTPLNISKWLKNAFITTWAIFLLFKLWWDVHAQTQNFGSIPSNPVPKNILAKDNVEDNKKKKTTFDVDWLAKPMFWFWVHVPKEWKANPTYMVDLSWIRPYLLFKNWVKVDAWISMSPYMSVKWKGWNWIWLSSRVTSPDGAALWVVVTKDANWGVNAGLVAHVKWWISKLFNLFRWKSKKQ